MKFPVLDEEFESFVSGKSVSLVGRAPYLRERRFGAIIDESDLVFRLHSNMPNPGGDLDLKVKGKTFVQREMHEHVGSRTDVFDYPLSWASQKTIEELYKWLKKCGASWGMVDIPHSVKDSVAQLDAATEHLPVHVTPLEHYAELSRVLDYAYPLPGSLLIFDVLLHNPTSVFLAGFSCFQDTESKGQPTMTLMNNHHPRLDYCWVRDLVRNDERVTADAVMMEMFLGVA